MADIARVAQADLGSVSANTLTVAFDCGAGANYLVVGAFGGSLGNPPTDQITGVTYNGVAMTRLSGVFPTLAANHRGLALYGLVAPASGSNNIVITTSAGSFIAGIAASYSGVGSAGQPNATGTAFTSGSAASLTVSCTTTIDRCRVVSYVAEGGGTTLTGGAGTTVVSNGAFDGTGMVESTSVVGVGSTSLISNRAGSPADWFGVIAALAPPSCAAGGSIIASINEGDIVTGGKVLTLTLSGDTWVAAGGGAGQFDPERQNIINGLDSAQSEATGWDAVVKAGLVPSNVVRTSNNIVTITLPAFATFNITATETITATPPSTALTSGVALGSPAAPTFTITANTALSAGTASFVSKTATAMSVSASAPTGGTAPYTYQWERRVANTGSYSNVSGATSLTLTQTGLTSGELYEYRCKQTDNVAAVVTTNSIAVTRTWIDPNNQNIYFSPYNWYSDGGSALAGNNIKGGSGYALANNAGAYFKTKVTTPASGSIKIELDTSMLSGITANQCPSFYCAIDGGPATLTPVTLAYSASTVELTLASGLSAATHTVEFFFKGLYTGDGLPGNESDRWNPVRQAIKILGLDINTTATMVAPSVRSKKLIAYGASHYEGIDCLGTGGTTNANVDATRSIIYMLARALDAEFGVVAFSGQGFVKGINRVTASAVEPALKNADPTKESWDKYYSGQSRLVGGLYSPAPDYVIIGTATNDYAVPLAAGNVTPALDAIRTAAGTSAWIFVVNDIAGSQSAALAGGVAAAAVQTRLRHIIPTILVTTIDGFQSTGTPSYFSFDSASGGAHPNPEGNQAHGAEVIALIKAQLDAAGTAGMMYRNTMGGNLA